MIYLELYLTFLKIGSFGFGGGYAMVPLMQQEIVGKGWLSLNDFLNVVSISQMTPGPIGINAATFSGIKTASIFGGVVATLGIITPSFILLILVGSLYYRHKTSKSIIGIMKGVRPAVIGLIASAVIVFARMSLVTGNSWDDLMIHPGAIAIFCAVILLVKKFKMNPILGIVFSAVAGILIC